MGKQPSYAWCIRLRGPTYFLILTFRSYYNKHPSRLHRCAPHWFSTIVCIRTCSYALQWCVSTEFWCEQASRRIYIWEWCHGLVYVSTEFVGIHIRDLLDDKWCWDVDISCRWMRRVTYALVSIRQICQSGIISFVSVSISAANSQSSFKSRGI